MSESVFGYRIERCFIPQDNAGSSKEVWFLDAVLVSDVGGKRHKTTSNICNGDYDYCLKTMQARCGQLLP